MWHNRLRKGGDHDSGGGSSTAAATADAPFLSYNDPDSGYPLPGFAASKFDPSSSVGLHLQSPHIGNKMVKSLPKEQQTFSLHIHIISVYANLFKVMLFRKYRNRQCFSFGGDESRFSAKLIFSASFK